MNPVNDIISGLPGEQLVRQGFADLRQGRFTIPACLVSVAKTRLCSSGAFDCAGLAFVPDPEHELYRLLRQEGGDAYSRYNSFLRELISFTQALDHVVG